MSAPLLNDREKEILNNIVEVWDENDAPLEGRMSYGEVFALLDKLGVPRPAKISAFIDSVDKPKGKKQ